jgi:hypothetical protein
MLHLSEGAVALKAMSIATASEWMRARAGWLEQKGNPITSSSLRTLWVWRQVYLED